MKDPRFRPPLATRLNAVVAHSKLTFSEKQIVPLIPGEYRTTNQRVRVLPTQFTDGVKEWMQVSPIGNWDQRNAPVVITVMPKHVAVLRL